MSKLLDLMESYGGVGKKYLGKIIAIPPLGGDIVFNFTLPKGKGTGLWLGFLSWLGNKGYTVQKYDESLEISPVDSAYYALTQRQKEEMEAKIKQSLASIASSVADYELWMHDLRKYKEFLKLIEKNDEHSLRAIFIDEVDIATGANSIKQMVARWPTMIADFMTLGEKMPEEIDAEKIRTALNISKAEAIILSTKQRLYLNWKKMFGSEVRRRVENILAQVNSRKKSIEEFKNWLKPLVARHKLYKEGLASPETVKSTLTNIWHSPGQAISTNVITIFAWQPIVGIEARTGTLKLKNKAAIPPYDDFIKKKVIFSGEGLKKYYSWIDEKWVNENVKNILDAGWLKEDALYYVFHEVTHERAIIRLPTGDEMEDVTYNTKAWFLSQNALLAVLLELKAKQEQFNMEIDELIGISKGGIKTEEELEKIIEKWKNEEKNEKKETGRLKEKFKKINNTFSKISNTLGMNIGFTRFGPYESNFKDRITNIYLMNVMVDFYIPHIKLYLLENAGVGK